MENLQRQTNKDRRGSGLILTILTLALIMSVGLSIMTISNIQTKMSTRTRNSSKAYQYADSGAELALGKILRAKRKVISYCNTVAPGSPDYNEHCTGTGPDHLRLKSNNPADAIDPERSVFYEKDFIDDKFSYTEADAGFVADIYLYDVSMNLITNANSSKADDVYYVRSVGIVRSGTLDGDVARAVLVSVPKVDGE